MKVTFFQSNNLQAALQKQCVFSRIAFLLFLCAMPVIAIALQGNIVLGQIEINEIATYGIFLNEVDAKFSQRDTNGSLETCFASKATKATLRTKPLFVGWSCLELATTHFTNKGMRGRTPTLPHSIAIALFGLGYLGSHVSTRSNIGLCCGALPRQLTKEFAGSGAALFVILPLICNSFRSIAARDVERIKPMPQGVITHLKFARYLLNTLALGYIHLDKQIADGHVIAFFNRLLSITRHCNRTTLPRTRSCARRLASLDFKGIATGLAAFCNTVSFHIDIIPHRQMIYNCRCAISPVVK